jgi:hypothetical protein
MKMMPRITKGMKPWILQLIMVTGMVVAKEMIIIQDDQKVPAHLMITTQKVSA